MIRLLYIRHYQAKKVSNGTFSVTKFCNLNCVFFLFNCLSHTFLYIKTEKQSFCISTVKTKKKKKNHTKKPRTQNNNKNPKLKKKFKKFTSSVAKELKLLSIASFSFLLLLSLFPYYGVFC